MRGLVSSLLGATLAISFVPAEAIATATVYSYETRQPQRSKAVVRPPAKPRAPVTPPLTSLPPSSQGEETMGFPAASGDQLVENGMSSPLCAGGVRGVLSRAAQSNCETSGFIGAPAPTNNYALDVHIDTGTFGLSKGALVSVIQDTFIAPLWSLIVWGLHALLVMLEWCYSLELLDGSTVGSFARPLQQAQASFTEPWLALVLAVASGLALYNGLVRRRIAETLGQALLTFAMTVAGLWVIANPLGTVGAVGEWSNQASLGTLGSVSRGTPVGSQRTLADDARAVFAASVETPWCYLEFGNVRWCSDPSLLEPRLRKAAMARLVAHRPDAPTAQARRERELVGEADTNGQLFLAFAANGPQRNSVKEATSLLHVICESEDDTKCRGPAAAEAEFRSDGGTLPRAIGLVLIAAGTLGMALLFGLVTVRLLAAAALGLFMLLLAPFAVLAPALGDGGRALFGGWAVRLLGAFTSKLIFSFVLGALLVTQRILMALPLGWWTQWLLVSAFWWTAFFKRHQATELLHNRGHAPELTGVVKLRVKTLDMHRAISRPLDWARRRLPLEHA
ncbi:MAG TPA: hypothetical protein VGI26_08015 [Solirubrobacteraceae bacterium]